MSVLIGAALALVALAFLLPQLWLFSLSLKDRGAVFAYPPRWIPADPSLDNYVFALTGTQVPWYLWNSVKVAVVATLLTLAAGIPAAYVLSRERFAGRGPLLAMLLAVQMISPVVLLLPLYVLVERLGLVDTHTGAYPRLRGDPGAVHGVGAQELLRCACRRRSSKPRGSMAPRACARCGRSRCRWSRRALPPHHLQSGGILVGVRAGARAARFAVAVYDPDRRLQSSERLRNRVAARRRRQLHRPRADDGRLHLSPALLHRRSDGRRRKG